MLTEFHDAGGFSLGQTWQFCLLNVDSLDRVAQPVAQEADGDCNSVMAFLALLSCTAIFLALLLASHASVFCPAFLYFHVILLIAVLAVFACTAIFLHFIAFIATPIGIPASLIFLVIKALEVGGTFNKRLTKEIILRSSIDLE